MLKLESLTKQFRSGGEVVTAVDDVSLALEPGEMLVLLGPSGCGKTTALRCIAGLESADRGRITFGSRTVFDAADVIDVPPEKRDIGMVFQSYALWPHKTVRDNIAYPLKVRKMTKELGEGWVESVAGVVDCTHLLDRYPGQLSGGQQQRIALARGLVARPDLVLFDEPLSNLDALLRLQVRNELHELHERLGFTGVYVTHDQTEALALGNRLAVMRKGSIEQLGSPREIYESPTSEYVAEFVGFADMLPFVRTGDGWSVPGSEQRIPLAAPAGATSMRLRFRPEQCLLVSPGAARPDGVSVSVRVVDVVYAGAHEEAIVEIGDTRVLAVVPVERDLSLAAGTEVVLVVPWSRCRWFAEDGSRVDGAGAPS